MISASVAGLADYDPENGNIPKAAGEGIVNSVTVMPRAVTHIVAPDRGNAAILLSCISLIVAES